jgi:hypothetical protein
MSYPLVGKTVGQHRAAPIVEAADHDVARRIADALVKDFGNYRSTRKLIAGLSGATTESAKNWLEAMNCPNALYLLRLMAHSPTLRDVVDEMTTRPAEAPAPRTANRKA